MSAGIATFSGPMIGRVVVASWTGRQLRALRVAARLEVAALAAAMDVDETTVSRWEDTPSAELPIDVQVRLDSLYGAVDDATAARFWHLVFDAMPSSPTVWPSANPAPANLALHGLLRAAQLSRADLANLVRAEATPGGRTYRIDQTRVDRWLAGWSASPAVAGHVAVLSERLGRLVTVEETGLVRRYPNRIRQLRLAKPRPWSQDRLIVAIEQAARDLGRLVPTSRRSLKTMVSRWENGHHRITPENRRLLCRALSCLDSDLDAPPFSGGIALLPDHR